MKLNKRSVLYIAFFFLTLQDSKALVNLGYGRIVQYIGLFLLLIGCATGFMENRSDRKSRFFIYILTLAVTNIGLFYQKLEVNTKFSLFISMVLLVTIAVFPNGLIKRDIDFKRIAVSILSASMVSFLLALVFGVDITSIASEGLLLSVGFNAGSQNKNYFAYSMLAVIILLDMYRVNNPNKAKELKCFAILLLLLANSRSAIIVWIVYLYFSNLQLLKLKGYFKQITVFIFFLVVVLAGQPVFTYLVHNSQNFSFRINGLYNYLNYVADDWFHIIFGYAEMAFRNEYTYAVNVRSTIGWDGSVEFAFLNVMLKNGLIGLVGYIFMFVFLHHKIKEMKPCKEKDNVLGVFWAFLLSSLVESFIVQLAFVFSPVMYSIIAFIPWQQQSDDLKRNRENSCVRGKRFAVRF